MNDLNISANKSYETDFSTFKRKLMKIKYNTLTKHITLLIKGNGQSNEKLFFKIIKSYVMNHVYDSKFMLSG